MAKCGVITLSGNSPDPTAPIHIDHYAVIAAEASLRTWQDPTLLENFVLNGEEVQRWNSRVGSTYYEQATQANRPARKAGTDAGAKNSVPYVLFDGSSDRLAPNGVPVLDPASAFSVFFVVKPTLYDTNRYLFGTNITNDNLYLMASSAGTIRFAMGDASPQNIVHPVNTWTAGLVTWNGAGKRQRLFVGGQRVETAVVTAPTTTRALTMGATSNLSGAGLYAGGYAEMILFAKDIGDDAALLSIVSQYARAKYAMPYEPFVLT